MIYCPVMPPALVDKLLKLRSAPKIGYFCYADIAMKDAAYRDFFKARTETGEYVVLDCPVMEEQPPVPPREFAALVKEINPSFAFIPDIQFDRRASLVAFEKYLEFLDHPSACGVVQGRKIDDLAMSGVEMVKGGIRNLAIPRTNRMDRSSRADIIDLITDRLLDEQGQVELRFHLLGAVWPYKDEARCVSLNMVSSIDSAEPVNAALRRLPLGESTVKRETGFREADYVSVAWLNSNVSDFIKRLERP